MGKKPKAVIAPSNWSRFGNPRGMWVSPANFYKNWKYQNYKGEIISTEIAAKMIKETKLIYSSYNVLTMKESISKKTIFNYFPKNVKKLVKKLLSKIFPLYIG